MMAQLESMSEGVVACLFVLTFSTGMKLTLTNEQKSGKSETSSTQSMRRIYQPTYVYASRILRQNGRSYRGGARQ